MIGFKAAIGLVIVVDQIPKLLGIHFEKGTFLHNLLAIFSHIPEISIPTLLVSVIMILLLVGIEHFFPRAPAPLIAVGVGIIGMKFFGLQQFGITAVGSIPRGLPSLRLPDLSLTAQLWPGALGIALMSFTETIAAGRAFAKSEEPPIKANQELFATGIANVGGTFLGAMPGGGGTSQTAINRLAGAKTQLSELITAGSTLVTMLFLAPLIAQMPNATLAAVVIVYSIGLIKPLEFNAILSIRRMEFIWALAAFAGVVLLGTLQGIIVAIIVSLVSLAHQIADPPVHILGRKRGTNIYRPLSKKHPDDETFPGLLLLRPEGRIFFANAEIIGQKMKRLFEGSNAKIVAFDLRAVPDLEYTALKMLIDSERRLRDGGILLWLVGLNPQVLHCVQRSALAETLGPKRLHFNLESAVAQYLDQTKSDH
jgi:MFS superfamily sulfate permease-like transporter